MKMRIIVQLDVDLGLMAEEHGENTPTPRRDARDKILYLLRETLDTVSYKDAIRYVDVR